MPDIDELSKRCKVYRLKSILKYIFLPFILLLIVVYVSYYFYENKIDNFKKSNDLNSTVITINEIKKEKIEKKEVEKKLLLPVKKESYSSIKVLQFTAVAKRNFSVLKKKRKIVENMGFSCYIKEDDRLFRLRCLIPDNFKDVKKLLNNKKIDFFITAENEKFLNELNLKRSIVKIDNTIKEIKKAKSKKVEDIKHNKIITPQSSSILASKKATIDELIKQYFNRPSFSRAIMISREFFNKEDFKNAAKWAKKANYIDREREEGWILYAKSIDALGQRDKAIKSLEIFLSFKNSDSARKLLKQLKRVQK